MRCSNCANHDLVSITLKIADEPVAFYRCPGCDSHTWEGRDGAMSREGVLELVRTNR